jgi:diacylglycerol kinase (ATP)
VDLDLVVDGEPMSLKSVNNLTIAKNPYIASGLKLRLDLLPSDGKLCVVGISDKSRLGQMGLLPRFYNGSVSTAPGVLVRECRSVEVTSSQPQRIEFDGDPRGFLPVRIDILPKALSLIGGAND